MRLPFYTFILPGLFLISGGFIQGQEMKYLTADDGLSQGFVPSILQTRDGFLWMATLDGLNRYDGIRFKVYREDPLDSSSLNSNFVLKLFEDSSQRLWVATDQGLSCMDRYSERFYPLDKNKQPWLKNNSNLHFLTEQSEGTFWAFSDHHLYQLIFSKKEKTIPNILESIQVKTWPIPEREHGVLVGIALTDTAVWIGCAQTLLHLSFRDGKIQPNPVQLPTRVFSFSRDSSSGALWIQGSNGVYEYARPGGRHTFYPFQPPFDNPSANRLAGQKNTWFFTSHRIYRLNGSHCEALPYYIPEKIQSVYLDREGILWIGTNAAGLRKIVLDRFRFPAFSPGLSLQKWVLGDRNNQIWIGAPFRQKWVYRRFDPAKNSFAEPLSDFVAGWPVHDRNGAYWILSESGVLYNQAAPGERRLEYPVGAKPHERFNQLLEDRSGHLLFASTGMELIRFDPKTKRFSRFSYQNLFPKDYNLQVLALCADAEGSIWIGTSKGLIKAAPRAGTGGYDFHRDIFSDQRVNASRILSLLADPDNGGILWAGTQNGLYRLETATGRTTRLALRNGIPNKVICSLLPGEKYSIWMGTYFGLMEMDTRTFNWRHFTVEDGLPANEFNQGAAARLPDGRLVFGGVNGFTVFNPASIPRRDQKLPLKLTGLIVSNQMVLTGGPDGILSASIDHTKSITLKYNQDDVAFNFAFLDLANPAGNRYYCRMEGIDADWQIIRTRTSAAYTNLMPRRYVFWLKAHSSSGVWSEPLSLEIWVRPPWWQTWWAYSLYAIAVLGLILSGLWFWAVQIRLRYQLKLESRETERLKELDLFKSELYANVTHELRTPMTVILGLAEQLDAHLTGEWKTKANSITRNGEKILRLIQQILDLSRIEASSLHLNWQQQDMVPFVRYVAGLYTATAGQKNIRFQLELPDDPLLMDFDVQRLQAVLDNLLSNAFKFTQACGEVRLRLLQPDEQHIRLVVADTGIGIAKVHLDKIFDRYYQVNGQSLESAGGSGIGLAYSKALVNLMGGTIRVESQPDEGTVFTVDLPIRREAPLSVPGSDAGLIRIPRAPLTEPAGQGVDRELTQAVFAQPGIPEESLIQILVIEDDPDVAAYIASCLEGLYRVRIAENGRMGLKMAFELIPDIVISDISMPDYNGLEVCRTLKNDWRTSHVPVLLLTARVESEQRLAGLEQGADVYLTKPFVFQELLAHIQNLLQLRAAIQSHYQKTGEQMALRSGRQVPVEDGFIRAIFDCIENGYRSPEFNIPEICRAVSMSNAQLHRKLKALTGQAPGHFLRLHRLEQAKKLLTENSKLTIAEVAYQSGFSDASYFIRAFTAEYGQTPGSYRETAY